MGELGERFTGFVRALPVAHRVGIVAALGVLLVAGLAFVRWVTTPSFTVLYAGLEQGEVADVIDRLETSGVPYELQAGGTTVLVPREHLYQTRATLAGEGVAGRTAPEGYEILEQQGLSVSEFRQRVDYRRALEGELSRTLQAMTGITSANVHLVIPEESLLAQQRRPVTASVVLQTSRQLGPDEVDAVTFVTASAVEGLEVDQITVADASGSVLHASGEMGGSAVTTNRNLRQTQEYERALAAEVAALLEVATGGSPASVVVRASMNYDEEETERETFDPDTQVTLREQTSVETYEGTGMLPGGPVGVDGGPLPEAEESAYDRDDQLREFGVNRTLSRVVAAPGRVEGLSVAIVMDDGSLTGVAVPPVEEVRNLVNAALGLDEARGDEVAVSTVAMPAIEDVAVEGGGLDVMGLVPQIVAGVVLLLVAVGLFLMTRRRQVVVEDVERQPAIDLRPASLPSEESAPPPAPVDPNEQLRREVTALVEHQPEEIATLLRGWLADRRSSPRVNVP